MFQQQFPLLIIRTRLAWQPCQRPCMLETYLGAYVGMYGQFRTPGSSIFCNDQHCMRITERYRCPTSPPVCRYFLWGSVLPRV